MNLDARLAAWREAALVTEEQARAIREFEEKRRGNSRTWVVGALGALGGLAIAAGLVSLVASNWERIAPGVKLAAAFALLAGCLAAAYACSRDGRTLASDLFLFAHGGISLALIGLVSQVYHLSGAPWRALALATAIAIPAAAISDRALSSDLAVAFALATVWLVVEKSAYAILRGFGAALVWAAAGAVLLFLAEAVRRVHPAATRALRRWGGAVLFAVSIAAAFAWSIDWGRGTLLAVGALCAVLAAAWIARLAWKRQGPLVVAALALTFLILGPSALSHVRSSEAGLRFIGFALFCTAGVAFAMGAAQAGSRRLTNLFTLAVAGRVLLLFVEVLKSLALTGVGLLLTGVVFCAIAWGWWKLHDALPVQEVARDG
jgi:uncharacterized membrane protein